MNVAWTGIDADVDEDGYLLQVADWTPAIAQQLAERQGLQLNAEHWAVIEAIRRFYQHYQRSPTTRVLLKYLAQELGPTQAGSIYLMSLFGDGTPAKTIARIAGLPKPANCI